MRASVLHTKSVSFAIRIINLYKYLIAEKKEFVLSKQLLRSGTAIGAMISEAQFAQTKPDFITKLHIAVKEANEATYWLYLMYKTDYILEAEYCSLKIDCDELLKLLTASLKTAKSNINQKE